jgi:hypothetical protein
MKICAKNCFKDTKARYTKFWVQLCIVLKLMPKLIDEKYPHQTHDNDDFGQSTYL